MAADTKLFENDFDCVEKEILRIVKNINFMCHDLSIKSRKRSHKFQEIQNPSKSIVIDSFEDKKYRNGASTSKMEASASAPDQELKLDDSNSTLENLPQVSSLIKRIEYQRILAEELFLTRRLHQQLMKGLDTFDRLLGEPLQQMNAASESYSFGEPSYVSTREDSRNEVDTDIYISEDSGRKMDDSPCIAGISRKNFLRIKKSVEENIFNLEQWIEETEFEIVNSRGELNMLVGGRFDKQRGINSSSEIESYIYNYFDRKDSDFYHEMQIELGELQLAEEGISKWSVYRSDPDNESFLEFSENGSPDEHRHTALLPQPTVVDDQIFFDYFRRRENRKLYNEGIRETLSENKPSSSHRRQCTGRPEITVPANEAPEVVNTSVESSPNGAENEHNPNMKPVEFISHPADQPEMTVQANKASKMNASKRLSANNDETSDVGNTSK